MRTRYSDLREEGPCHPERRILVLPPLELEVRPLTVLVPPTLPTLNRELKEYEEAFNRDDLLTILKKPVLSPS